MESKWWLCISRVFVVYTIVSIMVSMFSPLRLPLLACPKFAVVRCADHPQRWNTSGTFEVFQGEEQAFAYPACRWYAGDVAKGNARIESSGEDAPFGARLRRLREAAGLTQEELAGEAGLTAKAVSLLERGERRRPYPHTVRALADALGLPEVERASSSRRYPARSGGAPFYRWGVRRVPSCRCRRSLTPLLGRDREVEEISGLLGGPPSGC